MCRFAAGLCHDTYCAESHYNRALSFSAIEVAIIPVHVLITYLLYGVFAIVPLWDFVHFCLYALGADILWD